MSDLIEISVELAGDTIEAEAEMTDETIETETEFETNVTVNAGTDKMTITAGENISGGNVVMVINGKAFKYQPGDEANYGKAVGIAKHAALTDDELNITLGGKMAYPGWNLTPGEVHYAIADGGLSTTPPSSGLLSQIGLAKDADTMLIEIDEPTIL